MLGGVSRARRLAKRIKPLRDDRARGPAAP
jgi:hypothetical protein